MTDDQLQIDLHLEDTSNEAECDYGFIEPDPETQCTYIFINAVYLNHMSTLSVLGMEQS